MSVHTGIHDVRVCGFFECKQLTIMVYDTEDRSDFYCIERSKICKDAHFVLAVLSIAFRTPVMRLRSDLPRLIANGRSTYRGDE